MSGSINRALCLQEGSIDLEGSRINTSFESHHFPLLFIAGEVPCPDALEHLIRCMPSSELRGQIEAAVTEATLPKVPATESRSMTPVLYILEVEGDGAQCLNVGCVLKVNERVTISSAEILQCHTFTKCLLCTVVPPGFTIGDLCTPRESYHVHSYFSLGESVEKNRQDGSSQAYTGVSAIEPHPTREQSTVSQSNSGMDCSASEQNQQAAKSSNEQLTPTLPWTAKPIDQQPIAPSRKKERPSVRPSSRQGSNANQSLKTSPAIDQDVEMTDAACDEGFKKAPRPAVSAVSGDDPIESYGSNKTNNEDMEVDLEGSLPVEAKVGTNHPRKPLLPSPVHKSPDRILAGQTVRRKLRLPQRLRTTMLVGHQVSLSSSTLHHWPKTERRETRQHWEGWTPTLARRQENDRSRLDTKPHHQEKPRIPTSALSFRKQSTHLLESTSWDWRAWEECVLVHWAALHPVPARSKGPHWCCYYPGMSPVWTHTTCIPTFHTLERRGAWLYQLERPTRNKQLLFFLTGCGGSLGYRQKVRTEWRTSNISRQSLSSAHSVRQRKLHIFVWEEVSRNDRNTIGFFFIAGCGRSRIQSIVERHLTKKRTSDISRKSMTETPWGP